MIQVAADSDGLEVLDYSDYQPFQVETQDFSPFLALGSLLLAILFMSLYALRTLSVFAQVVQASCR